MSIMLVTATGQKLHTIKTKKMLKFDDVFLVSMVENM